jgi:outer membrane receptor protein involved in Fe transport
MPAPSKRYCALLLAAVALAAVALPPAAQGADGLAAAGLEDISVVGSTPLAGSDIDRDRVPAATQVLHSRDVDRTGIPGLTGAILSSVPSATINDVEGNVFQPDILFRGFTASPVAGTPQGLAVYVNGARFNEAFGDTVNWDLIPPSAIQAVDIEASNPVFGLNALGGSVSVRLKNGFGDDSASVTAYGGSYGRGAGIAELSRKFDHFAAYLTVDGTHDDGFRQTSASNLYRAYGDLGWRDAETELHVDITAAHDTLGNPGATPVQALAANIANIFTAPNSVDNKYLALDLNGTGKLSETLSVQGVAYFHDFRQQVPNGTTAEVQACGGGTDLLCNDDGTVVTTTGGQNVTDFLHGAIYSGLSVQDLQSHAYGTTVQATDQRPIGGLTNHLVVGASFDGSDSTFSGSALLGGFNPYTREFIGPGVVQDQPSEGVNPVRVLSTTRFFALFASELYPLARDLDLAISGRFNDARISLEDELGGPVNGQHAYYRFNPSAGLTYRIAPGGQVYGSYSETNRVPTPQELSCASAANPCSLLNFFVGDPNLAQVVAHTAEVGVRGKLPDAAGGTTSWNVDLYHTQNTNDIIYESTVENPNLAFYTNAGKTLRQGLEANLQYEQGKLRLKAGYAYTDARFRSALDLNSGSNPDADINGQIHVVSGDRIPGIPKHRANLIVDYTLNERWTFGAEAVVQSDAYRFGDESNLTAPVGGYAVVDLNVAYRPVDRITLFLVANNVFNRRYDTYGSFGPVGDVPWPNVPGGVTDPRTASPGTPLAAYGGVRVNF